MTGLVRYEIIDPEHIGRRLDNYLFALLNAVPKSHIYKALRKGEFRVNKKRVQADYRIEEGDVLRIPPLFHAEKASVILKPSDQWLDILKESVLYENEMMLAINKPAGIAVHAGSGIDYGLIEALRALYPQYPHLELAHRLDRDTSGCLLIAKKRSGLVLLHDAFRAGTVQKSYYALTLGHWLKKDIRVDAPLRKYQTVSGERRVVVDKMEGKPSLSQFECIERFQQASFVLARPATGRTHQLRVHAQYRKHPIAGDDKYGDKEFNQLMKAFGLNRLFLHAAKVKLNLPQYLDPVVIEAPLAPVLASVLVALRASTPYNPPNV